MKPKNMTFKWLLVLALVPSPGFSEPAGTTLADKGARIATRIVSAEIESRIERIIQEKDPRELERMEKELIDQIIFLHGQQKLKPVLREIGEHALATGKLPPRITAANLNEYIDRLENMIEAELKAHGKIKGYDKVPYRTWDELAKDQLAKVRSGRNDDLRRQPGVKDAEFRADIERLADTRFLSFASVRPLINGVASFPLRKSLIEGARKSIHVMSWAFEDDHTGEVFSKLLIERFKSGVDVKVLVDRKTAELTGYRRNVEAMERAGVPLIRWTNPERDYYGFHRKLLVVDSSQVIAGGMNFGDVYSHMGDEKTPKWRDTDVLVQGEAAAYAGKVFADVWNEQVRTRKLAFPATDTPSISPKRASASDPSVAIIDHVPNPKGHDGIMLAILKAIESARNSVDIANAYYIRTPALEHALVAARERGVKVRLLTNSAESVDVPVISKPIVNSLPPLIEKGIEVYLKTGPTLHSKVMVVDNFASFVMSYNHHPQSLRTQGEVAFLILDEDLASKLTSAYQQDIGGAQRATDPGAVRMDNSTLDFIVTRYFFDQL